MLDGITYTATAGVSFDLLAYLIGNYHYNWHEQIELIWLLKGTVDANVDGHQYTMQEDDLILINTNSGHATFALTENCIAMRLHLDPKTLIDQGVDLTYGSFELNSVKVPRHKDYDLIRQLLAQLYLGMQAGKHNQFEINRHYYRLVGLLVSDFFNPTTQLTVRLQRRQGSLRRVISYINEAYDQEISLKKAAELSHYSTAYLSRIFKAELGINFYEYRTRCRLQHALFDLEDPHAKIADVAFENGFKEVKSFNQMFKKHFGQTPSAYRSHLTDHERPQSDQFKQPLTVKQGEWLKERLNGWLTRRTLTPLSACENCGYRTHFVEYQELKEKVNQLKALLDQ